MRKNILALSVTTLVLAALPIRASQSAFESRGVVEMNKLNKDALFLQHKYMLGFVTDDKHCKTESCQNGLDVILKTVEKVKKKIEVTPVWINSTDNKRLVKNLRIVESDSIVYLALGRAVVF